MRSSSLLLLGASSIAWARVAPAPPAITPAPSSERIELRRRQLDIGSLAPILVTAVPPSLLNLALTNLPAVSAQLWSEFLDDKKPSWFTELPASVQQYLSSEFGPTTTASSSASTTSSATSSGPAASETALKNQVDDPSDKGGLPLWAKIVIGIFVPLVVLGLLALLLLCCLRRRRKRRMTSRQKADSRVPTPAFISSSHRAAPTQQMAEHDVPLRGGYLSSPDTYDHTPRSSRNISSDSEDFQTPIGGPSYEDMQPVEAPAAVPAAVPAAGMQHSNRSRGSRQSFSSLHSVPEVPEPMYDRYYGTPGAMGVPPRSPRRSRDLSQEGSMNSMNNNPGNRNSRRISPLNPLYNDPYTAGQGIYAGGQNPYPSHGSEYRHDDPFSDPSPPRQSNYLPGGGHHGGAGRDHELFLPSHWDKHTGVEHSQQEHSQQESNWPLQALHESGYHTVGKSERPSWERGDDRNPVYEM